MDKLTELDRALLHRVDAKGFTASAIGRQFPETLAAILDAARSEGLPVGGGGGGGNMASRNSVTATPSALPADVSDTGKDADICSRGDRCVCQDPSPSRCNAFNNPDALPPGYGRTDQ